MAMRLESYPKAYFELMASASLLLLTMGLPSAFLSIFARELNPSEFLIGLVSSAWFISRIFVEMPSGALIDNFGKYRILAIGLALSAFGAFICSLANTIYLLILGRIIWGIGTSLFFSGSSATIFDLFESNVRGRALGIFQSIQFIGLFLGAPLGSFMAGIIGYNEVFLTSSILTLCSLLIVVMSKWLREVDNMQVRKRSLSFMKTSIKQVLPNVKNWPLTAIYINSFTRMMMWSGLSTFFPLFLSDLGIKVELIGLVFAFRTLGIIFSTTISGLLSDRIGRKPVIILGLAVIAFTLYVCTLTSLISIIEILFLVGLLNGCGQGLVLTSLMTLLSDAAPPKNRGGALGVYRTFMDLGGFIGPLFFMEIFGRMGAYPAFMSGIAIAMVSIAFVSSIKVQNQSKFVNS